MIGALFALGKRSREWPGPGRGAARALLLFTFVPPLTALPNPIGIVWRMVGGYSYDPNLPFKNLFVISGDPIPKLRPYLDRLIGQVGLDPLDPVQPLARYAFERVIQPRDTRVVLVTTRFVYADGSSRVYDVPMAYPISGAFDLSFSYWQNDGLGRLRTQHLALPGQPFAAESSPIRLGDAVRLKLSPQADRLDAVNPAHWLWLSNRLQRLVWSPQGDAFLMVEQRSDRTQQLWLVPLDGSAPQPVNRGGSMFEYGWSPDGTFIVYTAPGEGLVTSGVQRDDATRRRAARRTATPHRPARHRQRQPAQSDPARHLVHTGRRVVADGLSDRRVNSRDRPARLGTGNRRLADLLAPGCLARRLARGLCLRRQPVLDESRRE